MPETFEFRAHEWLSWWHITEAENQVGGNLGATQDPWRTPPTPAVTTGHDLSAVPLSGHVYSTSGMGLFPEEASQRARLDTASPSPTPLLTIHDHLTLSEPPCPSQACAVSSLQPWRKRKESDMEEKHKGLQRRNRGAAVSRPIVPPVLSLPVQGVG